MKAEDPFRRLIEAFDDQDKADRAPKVSDVVGGPMVGWTFYVGEHLPPRTLMCSPDVFDALKSACKEKD